MGSINLRIDDELKARSYAALEKMGITPLKRFASCLSISRTMNACRSNRHSE
jgi:antitoxin component of RelBE/YafQ-DinJ toxin-antitoxin module